MIIRAPTGTGTEYTFNNPLFGYVVTVKLGTVISQARDGSYSIWDNNSGGNYDWRSLKCTWMLSAAEAANFVAAFGDSSKGRGVNVDFVFSSASGFFPFGPDLGDEGTFTCRCISCEERSIVAPPNANYFHFDTEFVKTYAPSYTPPVQASEGSLQIGTVSGLRYPPDLANPMIDYNVKTVLASDGSPHSIDKTTGDRNEVEMPLVLNESNMAALLAHLVGTVRNNAVTITPPSNAYLFGVAAGASGAQTCKLIQNTIEITHQLHNRYSTSLRFRKA